MVPDGDLMFLHRLEERALHLGRGAVDFVGEDEVGEDRAFLRGVGVVARVVNQGPDDVGRQQIGRELNALEVGMDAGSQRLDRGRLGQPGHALQKHVAVGEKADKQAFHEVLLAHHRFAHLTHDVGDPCASLGHLASEYIEFFFVHVEGKICFAFLTTGSNRETLGAGESCTAFFGPISHQVDLADRGRSMRIASPSWSVAAIGTMSFRESSIQVAVVSVFWVMRVNGTPHARSLFYTSPFSSLEGIL